MTIPALVLIDRIKSLAAEYRELSVLSNRLYNKYRTGGTKFERYSSARDFYEYEKVAEALDRLLDEKWK